MTLEETKTQLIADRDDLKKKIISLLSDLDADDENNKSLTKPYSEMVRLKKRQLDDMIDYLMDLNTRLSEYYTCPRHSIPHLRDTTECWPSTITCTY